MAVLVVLAVWCFGYLIRYHLEIRSDFGMVSKNKDAGNSNKDDKDNNKDENNGNTNGNNSNKDTIRIRFTQVWSNGHAGTRFLTGLLAAAGYFDAKDAGSNKTTDPYHYMVWHENELPLMSNRKPDGEVVLLDGSEVCRRAICNKNLQQFKSMMVRDYIPANNEGLQEFKRYIQSDFDFQKVKDWNTEGDKESLRNYIKHEQVPAFWSVYDRYNLWNENNEEKLTHFIKTGHTSIFTDLSDLYEIFSSAKATQIDRSSNTAKTVLVDVDFIRIKRNRMDIANSIASNGKPGPVEYTRQKIGLTTSPAMETALLRFEDLQGGPLPRGVWGNWTVYQQYLWFCDEIEARWRVFRKVHPEVRVYELAFTDVEGEPPDPKTNRTRQEISASSLDDMALNFLNLGHTLSLYLSRINKFSDVKDAKKTKDRRKKRQEKDDSRKEIPSLLIPKEMERQAIEYAKQAPWCLQYEGNKDSSVRYEYPILDCDVTAS